MASWVVRMGCVTLMSISAYRPPSAGSLLAVDLGGRQKLLQCYLHALSACNPRNESHRVATYRFVDSGTRANDVDLAKLFLCNFKHSF